MEKWRKHMTGSRAREIGIATADLNTTITAMVPERRKRSDRKWRIRGWEAAAGDFIFAGEKSAGHDVGSERRVLFEDFDGLASGIDTASLQASG